jgi:predicted RNase H-like nuclease
MSWVAGVDGCRAGWVVVLLQRRSKKYESEVRLCHNFAEVLALEPQPVVIAIDMPVGLLDTPQLGGRECDRRARKLLGRRASSIFPRRLVQC